jgi:hypothetical protein
MEKGTKNTTLELLRLLASWIQQVFLLVCGLMKSAAQ